MSRDEIGSLGSASMARRLRAAAVRAAIAGVRRTGSGVRDFMRQSLHFTIYIALVAGVAIWAIQRPAAKTAIKDKVAHARDKYVFDGDVGPTARTPADLQARLDNLEASVQAQLTQVRLAAGQGGGVVGSGKTAALPGRPADVRLMPYPFHSYLSITSDPDGMSFADFETIHRVLEETYQLPFSDQLFCCDYGSPHRPGYTESALGLNYDRDPPTPIDATRFHRLLVAHNRGWLEGIHGWHARGTASREQAFRLEAQAGKASREIEFEWTESAQPRDLVHLVFEYRLPVSGSHVTIRAAGKSLAIEGAPDGGPGISPAVTWTPVSVRVPVDAGAKFTIALEGPDGAVLEVRNAMMTNLARARVAADARVMAEYDLRYQLYSEHARLRNELTTGLRKDATGLTRPGVLVDNPGQAANFYSLPELERVGVGFINAVDETAQTEALSIMQLIHPHRFNDGVVRYAFQRYYAYPLTETGTPASPRDEHSWEPWLGFHLEQLLQRCGRFGEGGTIYTHWGVGNPKDLGLSPSTRKQLDVLRERYFNLSGATPIWDRVWVAPSAELLMFARAMQAVRDNASYDEAANVVHVRSWLDPVARQTIPAPRTRAFGLANLTFYVDRSATAKVLIDGREYTCVKRNPADQTGRESITIVDDTTPAVVLGDVDPLHRGGDFRSEGAECYFRHTGGFRGPKCLEVVLQEPSGKSEIAVPPVAAGSAQHLRFAYRKTNAKSLVGVRFVFDNGSELFAVEGAKNRAIGWTVPMAGDSDWHDCVLALTEIDGPRPLNRIPGGNVRSIAIEVENAAPGDRVFVDAVEFLQHPIHPPSPSGRHLIGGRVDPPTNGVMVILEDGPNRMQTKTAAGGYFYFPHAAETGAVVQLYALPDDHQPRFATAGRLLEIRRNEIELSIPLMDSRDTRTGKLEKKFKGESELNAKVGRTYKPRSDYVHSGIGSPQEFENHLQISNIGFLDRDRRPENPDGARRVLFLGNCNLFGHSTPRGQHPNMMLEDLLTRRTGYPTEVIALADSAMSFGKHWTYYRELGRPLHAEVACIFLQSSGVEMLEADPEAFARFYEYAPNHFPCSLFRGNADGGLTLIEPDAEYFRFVGKDPALRAVRDREKKKGGYYSDGVDWNTIYYRTNWDTLPAPARKAWDHFARVLRHYRDEMAKDGTRLVIVMTPEMQLSVGGLNKDFTDVDGQPCNSRLTGERVGKLCSDLGVGFLNVTPAAMKALPDPTYYTWRHDGHPSAYGNRVLAESVADYLQQTNFVRRNGGRAQPSDIRQAGWQGGK
ncbi:MAG TPA: hypothetical protein VHR66_24570 [Gemmataceae bacterium]|jgi:hypothetical protein|nr:hypothetical protein [Gemmataceae bacterium]